MIDRPMRTWARQLRLHQWAKNLLLFLPAASAHVLFDPAVLGAVGRAFLAFSMLASATYVANDLRDLDADRAHPTKRDRPLASGRIGAGSALAMAAILVVASGLLASRLPQPFWIALGAYLLLNTAYSFGLKRIVLVDVLVLATLFTLRVVAGAAAADVLLTRWFLAFSVFVFGSLALVKRAVELRELASRETAEDQAAGRGWRTVDLPVLYGLGTGSAVAGALVYCLYITGPDVTRLYGRPDLLWIGLPILLWLLGRVWIGVARDEVKDDPVAHAMTDPGAWIGVALMACVVWLAR